MVATTAAPRAALVRYAGRPWLPPAAAALAAAAVLGAVGLVDPNRSGHYPTCPFLALTGLYCPGCGSLRAIHAMAHGDLGTATARNPFTVLASAWLVVVWARWLRRRLTGRPRPSPAPAWMIWTLLGAVVAFWVLRNLPGFGFLGP